MTADLMQQSAKLSKRLAAIPTEILKYVHPALIKGAGDLADVARALVAVADGDLKASIIVTPPGGTTPAYAEGGGRRVAGENQALVTAGNSSTRHGHLIEFGTDPHLNSGQFSGTQHPGTDAHPFLYPAARLTEARTRRRIARAVGQAIRKGGKA